jgi:hypothetical protein
MHVKAAWSQQCVASSMGISALRIWQSVFGIASFREERGSRELASLFLANQVFVLLLLSASSPQLILYEYECRKEKSL